MSGPSTLKEKRRPLREGDRIADYTVMSKLGHGGYGDIYCVSSKLHPEDNVIFAMKIEYPNSSNSYKKQSGKNREDKQMKDNSNDNRSTQNTQNTQNQSNNTSQNKNHSKNDEQQNNQNTTDTSQFKDGNDKGKPVTNEKSRKAHLIRMLKKSYLYNEKEVLTKLQDSPYFPRYFSFGQTSLFRFMVIECFGPSVSAIRRILLSSKFSLSSSLRIGIEMLRAIHEFHKHGFIHRDIKPSNFLISPSLSYPIILIDYGLAKKFTVNQSNDIDNQKKILTVNSNNSMNRNQNNLDLSNENNLNQTNHSETKSNELDSNQQSNANVDSNPISNNQTKIPNSNDNNQSNSPNQINQSNSQNEGNQLAPKNDANSIPEIRSNENNQNNNIPDIKTNEIKNPTAKPKIGFAGTAKYASINAHENKELGRRDDLFSWFFSILELITGHLPWQSTRDKDEAYQLKLKADIKLFCRENNIPDQLISIYKLLKTYKFDDEPNYDLMESFLYDAMIQNGCAWNDKYEWHMMSDQVIQEISAIPLKPSPIDRPIIRSDLPMPLLPHKHKKKRKDTSHKNAELSDDPEFNQDAHINSVIRKQQNRQRRHSNYHQQPYSSQNNIRGPRKYTTEEDKERYGHFGSDQLFGPNNSETKKHLLNPPFTISLPKIPLKPQTTNTLPVKPEMKKINTIDKHKKRRKTIPRRSSPPARRHNESGNRHLSGQSSATSSTQIQLATESSSRFTLSAAQRTSSKNVIFSLSANYHSNTSDDISDVYSYGSYYSEYDYDNSEYNNDQNISNSNSHYSNQDSESSDEFPYISKRKRTNNYGTNYLFPSSCPAMEINHNLKKPKDTNGNRNCEIQ